MPRQGLVQKLLRCGSARKAAAKGADGNGVRHRIGLLLLTVVLVVPDCNSESTPVIRKRVSEVRLTLVATDRNDRPLPNLSPADIVVLEDGQPIPHFELRPAADLPLRVGIVLDLSDSTQKSWGTVRNTLLQSLQQSMRADDELLVTAFNTRIELERTVADPAQFAGGAGAPQDWRTHRPLRHAVSRLQSGDVHQQSGPASSRAHLVF